MRPRNSVVALIVYVIYIKIIFTVCRGETRCLKGTVMQKATWKP